MIKYDLEERTIAFSKSLIALCKKLKQDTINKPLISQIVRSGTSIGANYREANGAVSKKDFSNKIHICKKEAKETMYWIEILAGANTSMRDEFKKLWQESKELTMIFSKIASSSK